MKPSLLELETLDYNIERAWRELLADAQVVANVCRRLAHLVADVANSLTTRGKRRMFRYLSRSEKFNIVLAAKR